MPAVLKELKLANGFKLVHNVCVCLSVCLSLSLHVCQYLFVLLYLSVWYLYNWIFVLMSDLQVKLHGIPNVQAFLGYWVSKKLFINHVMYMYME